MKKNSFVRLLLAAILKASRRLSQHSPLCSSLIDFEVTGWQFLAFLGFGAALGLLVVVDMPTVVACTLVCYLTAYVTTEGARFILKGEER